MRYFADVDPDGRALGFYSPDIHAEIPPGAIEIDEATWRAWIADTARQRWHDGALVAADAPPMPTRPPIRVIAPLAFRRRLSPATRAAITLAAAADLETGDATLQTWLDDLAASREVDLDDLEVAAGVSALRDRGLITAAEQLALQADGTTAEAP